MKKILLLIIISLTSQGLLSQDLENIFGIKGGIDYFKYISNEGDIFTPF
ncbi:MAG: hypothetical protein ACI9SJ_001929 [Flavobacteriaceae bacterium]|jgi:hypothetical protein